MSSTTENPGSGFGLEAGEGDATWFMGTWRP